MYNAHRAKQRKNIGSMGLSHFVTILLLKLKLPLYNVIHMSQTIKKNIIIITHVTE